MLPVVAFAPNAGFPNGESVVLPPNAGLPNGDSLAPVVALAPNVGFPNEDSVVLAPNAGLPNGESLVPVVVLAPNAGFPNADSVALGVVLAPNVEFPKVGFPKAPDEVGALILSPNLGAVSFCPNADEPKAGLPNAGLPNAEEELAMVLLLELPEFDDPTGDGVSVGVPKENPFEKASVVPRIDEPPCEVGASLVSDFEGSSIISPALLCASTFADSSDPSATDRSLNNFR